MDSATLATMPDTYEPGRRARDAILGYLFDCWQRWECPPTYAEAEDALSMSHGGLQFHVQRLRDEGLVQPKCLWLTRSGHDEAVNRGLTN